LPPTRPPTQPSTLRISWLATGLVDLLLPLRCADCGEWNEHVLCPVCRACLDPDPGSDEPLQQIDDSLAAVAYSGSVCDWIQRFKYPRRGLAGIDPAPIGVLASLVSEVALEAPGPRPGLVVPVPLHPRRLRERGFNPAAVLAREVARAVGAQHAPRGLGRVRDTPSQTGLDRRARRRNVAGAFRCTRRMPSTVWLVDDVATTGATLCECARALRRAGARRVVAICVARTPASRPAVGPE
jgi:ComF family protein